MKNEKIQTNTVFAKFLGGKRTDNTFSPVTFLSGAGVVLLTSLVTLVFFVDKTVSSDVAAPVGTSFQAKLGHRSSAVNSTPVEIPSMVTSVPEIVSASDGPLPAIEDVMAIKPAVMLTAGKAPYYSRIARQNGYEGVVFLDLLVSEAGRVEHAEIVRSSGYKMLDREAVKAAREWQFAPAEQSGEPIASHVEVPVAFRLEE